MNAYVQPRCLLHGPLLLFHFELPGFVVGGGGGTYAAVGAHQHKIHIRHVGRGSEFLKLEDGAHVLPFLVQFEF